MKKFFIIVIAAIIIIRVNATVQFSEEIRYKDKDYALLNLPLSDLPEYIPLSAKFPNSDCTALGRDYIGYWKIVNDSLYLDSIKALLNREMLTRHSGPFHDLLSVVDIDDVMNKYRTPRGYFASWVNGEYYIADPDGGDYRNNRIEIYKEEIALTISNGKVVAKKPYHNKLFSGYLDSDSLYEKLSNFPIEKIPFVKPGRLVFSVALYDFDSIGKPHDARVWLFRHSKRQEFTPAQTDSIKALISEFFLTNEILPVFYERGKYIGYSYNALLITIEEE